MSQTEDHIVLPIRNSKYFAKVGNDFDVERGLNLVRGRLVDNQGATVDGTVIGLEPRKMRNSGWRYILWNTNTKQWIVRRKVGGRQTSLGLYDSVEAALVAMKIAGWPLIKK